MKKLKIDLEKQNNIILGRNERLESEDKNLRREFAKAFDWCLSRETRFGYSETKELKSPTWEEIFVEIGKLLAKQKALEYITDVENLRLRLYQLEVDFKEKELKENQSR